MATGKAAAAESYWKRVAANAPDPSGRIALANYYLWTRRSHDAREAVRPLENAPDPMGEVKSYVAAVLYAAGETTAGTALVDKEIARNRSNTRALLVKARMLMQEQQWQAAADHAEQAVAHAPESWIAQETLGAARARLEQFDHAIVAFKEAVRLNPAILPPRVELARALTAAGEGSNAIVVLQRAFPNQPTRAGAVANDIAWRVGGSGGDLDAALALAKFAVKRLPARAEPYDTLGTIYLKSGEVTEAIAAFEKSLSIVPGDATYRAHLAEARSASAAARTF